MTIKTDLEVLYDGIKCARWIKTNDGLWVLEIPLSETVLQNLCGQLWSQPDQNTTDYMV